MRTFSIQTLGCKVNQYESEQIASLLRARGLVPADSPHAADLRIINTCSVTVQAASKSRQTVRRSTRLPVIQPAKPPSGDAASTWPGILAQDRPQRSRVIVTGCWATSDRAEAQQLAGVDAVFGHHDDVAMELNRLLDRWGLEDGHRRAGGPPACSESPVLPEPLRDDVSMNPRAGIPASRLSITSKPQTSPGVKENVAGTRSLPLLDQRQDAHQRAFLKVQDGCDAHCTYCIIPRLRPGLWSKPIEHVVDEARRLVDAGHAEIVLTGIFLGAYGQPTALRRRQSRDRTSPLAQLLSALCTQVRGLRRLRFSSLEPGDLTPELLAVMRSHAPVVPHFHLPLQSGSDALLRRMNRQYTRDDYLRMLDEVNAAFDRPAITTDIIVGFPGETDSEFARTLEMVERAKFIHIHGFSYSPRPGTAAARWVQDFVRGPVVNERIGLLSAIASGHGYRFRRQFLRQTVEVLVERPRANGPLRHGRSERYFEVRFEDDTVQAGESIPVLIETVTEDATAGHRLLRPRSRNSSC